MNFSSKSEKSNINLDDILKSENSLEAIEKTAFRLSHFDNCYIVVKRISSLCIIVTNCNSYDEPF